MKKQSSPRSQIKLVPQKNVNDDMIRVVSFAGGVKSPELARNNKNRETPQLFGHIRNSKEEELND